MAVLDTLDIKISANAMNAAKALDQLANAMKRVRAALLNTKDGVTVGDQLSKSIHELNNAMNRINTSGIKKLNQLSSALHKFASAAKSLKGINIGQNVSKSIQNTQAALATQAGTATSPIGSADADDVSEDIKDVGDETEEAGKKAKKAAGFFKKLWDSIKRIAFYRAIRAAMKAVAEAFSDGLEKAYLFSKQSDNFKGIAKSLDYVKSLATQLTNQIGAFWGEFRQYIQPALEWLIEKVRRAAEVLTEFFAALNGKDKFEYAIFKQLEWKEATESVKEYKKQLLGLDELNNLSKNESKKKDEETSTTPDYVLKNVRDSFKGIAADWNSLKDMITGALEEIELALEGFMIGVGAALLFSGTNIPLGLGLIIAGGFMVYKEVKDNWDLLNGDISTTLTNIEELLGGFMAGIGAVLLFSGAAPQWGLGLLIAGIGIFSAAKKRKTDWNKIDKKTQETLTALSLTLGAALGILGAVLLFSGTNIPLGIGCLIAGIASISSSAKEAKNINWKRIGKKLDKTMTGLIGRAGLIAIDTALIAIGAVLAFSGTNLPLGLAMLGLGGVRLVQNVSEVDWDSVLKKLKETWSKIKVWFHNTVIYGLNDIHNKIEEALHFDLDSDGKIGGLPTKAPKVVEIGGTKPLDPSNIPSEPTLQTPTANSLAIQRLEQSIYNNQGSTAESSPWIAIQTQLGLELGEYTREQLGDFLEKTREGLLALPFIGEIIDKTKGGGSGKIFASGGIPKNGSLFYAGESGPEFVGAMGNSSAVANTGQMVEAIYKAAYMGVSRALSENGGLSGFEPATMDDLYIAIKKKSNVFSKRTGIPSTI